MKYFACYFCCTMFVIVAVRKPQFRSRRQSNTKGFKPPKKIAAASGASVVEPAAEQKPKRVSDLAIPTPAGILRKYPDATLKMVLALEISSVHQTTLLHQPHQLQRLQVHLKLQHQLNLVLQAHLVHRLQLQKRRERASVE